MSEFKLLIDRLTDKPQRFDFEADARWWSARAALDEERGEGRLEQPFRFELAASRLGDGILIEGRFEGGVSVECSRCTRRYAHALRDTFRLVLKPVKDTERGEGWGEGRSRESIDPEGERALAENGLCLGDDLEAGWFRGPVIFLDDFFAEIAALAMPIQPLCEEDCPGLCPHCGMERPGREGAAQDAAVCGCVDERVESPFAVLAKLKSGSGSEPEADRAGKTAKVRSTRGAGSGNRR
jgi:uncharacterized metal-binding protein YceD (DUF177 family)